MAGGIRVRGENGYCPESARVSANDLTDERQLDVLSGNAALNGVPVQVAAC